MLSTKRQSTSYCTAISVTDKQYEGPTSNFIITFRRGTSEDANRQQHYVIKAPYDGRCRTLYQQLISRLVGFRRG